MLVQAGGTARAQTLHQYLRRLNGLWLGPFALVALALAALAVMQVDAQRRAELSAAAERLAAAVDADLRRRCHGLQALAVSASPMRADLPLRDWYNEARAYDRTFDTPVLLVDARRRVLFNSRLELGADMPSLPKPAGRLDLEDALKGGEPKVGGVLFGPILGQFVVPITVPVHAGALAFVGAVKVEHFSPLLEQQHLQRGWHAAVFDDAGQPVVSSLPLSPPRGDPRAAGRGAQLSGGALRAAVAATAAPFTAVVQVDAAVFYRPHLQIGLALLLGVGFIVASVALVAQRAGQGLLDAVRQLSGPPADLSGRHLGRSAVPVIIEIEAARQGLTRASRAALEAEESERERIARELHDGLQQEAAVAGMHLDLALARLDAATEPAGLVRRARSSVDRVIHEIDHAVHDLRPHSLAVLGLSAALSEQVRRLAHPEGLQVELEFAGGEDRVDKLPKPVADGLFRIVQECLNNVRKHSQASFAHVVVDVSDPSQVQVTVSDDGVGIAADSDAAARRGLGLMSMAQRARALRGELSVRRGHHDDPQRGTTVWVRLPLDARGA